jgi:hypothetical protein
MACVLHVASATTRAPQREEFEIADNRVDRHGSAILEARIRPDVFENCDGPLSHVSDYWFYREAGGKVRLLPGQEGGERAGLIMPLDFADVTGDGKDTALFLMSGYNAGGYALFFVKECWFGGLWHDSDSRTKVRLTVEDRGVWRLAQTARNAILKGPTRLMATGPNIFGRKANTLIEQPGTSVATSHGGHRC